MVLSHESVLQNLADVIFIKMKKATVSIFTTLFFGVFLIYSCQKEEIKEVKTKFILKSTKEVANLSHLINLLNEQTVSALINNKYTLDLNNISGKYNFNYQTGQTIANEYIFIIPATLNSNSTTNKTYNVVITCILSDAKAVVMEESKELLSDGNYSVKLNILGNSESDAFEYRVNNEGKGIDFNHLPCSGTNTWWDCMKCVYADYTRDLVGQLTWFPAGVNVASVYCGFVIKDRYIKYILPA